MGREDTPIASKGSLPCSNDDPHSMRKAAMCFYRSERRSSSLQGNCPRTEQRQRNRGQQYLSPTGEYEELPAHDAQHGYKATVDGRIFTGRDVAKRHTTARWAQKRSR